MAQQLAEESTRTDAARRRLASSRPVRLSELGELNAHEFHLFLGLLGEALAEQAGPDQPVDRHTGDGLMHIRLEPLAPDSRAQLHTPAGTFSGRDHLLTIRPAQASTREEA
jgi:uncharacterized protein (TIGR02677 family)